MEFSVDTRGKGWVSESPDDDSFISLQKARNDKLKLPSIDAIVGDEAESSSTQMQQTLKQPDLDLNLVELEKRKTTLPCIQKIEYLQLHLNRRNEENRTCSRSLHIKNNTQNPPSMSYKDDHFGNMQASKYENPINFKDRVDVQSVKVEVPDATTPFHHPTSNSLSLENMFNAYPRFSSEMANHRSGPDISPKSFMWLSNFVEEFYDFCFVCLKLNECSKPADEIKFMCKDAYSRLAVKSLPALCSQYIRKTVGLPTLLDSTIKALILSVEQYRNANDYIELFSIFLREIWDMQYVVFFLLVRNNAKYCVSSKFPEFNASPKDMMCQRRKIANNSQAMLWKRMKLTKADCVKIFCSLRIKKQRAKDLLSQCNNGLKFVSTLNQHGYIELSAFYFAILEFFDTTCEEDLQSLESNSDETTTRLLGYVESTIQSENFKTALNTRLKQQIAESENLKTGINNLKYARSETKISELFIARRTLEHKVAEIECTRERLRCIESEKEEFWIKITGDYGRNSNDGMHCSRKNIQSIATERFSLTLDRFLMQKGLLNQLPREDAETTFTYGRKRAASVIKRFFLAYKQRQNARKEVAHIVSKQRERVARINRIALEKKEAENARIRLRLEMEEKTLLRHQLRLDNQYQRKLLIKEKFKQRGVVFFRKHIKERRMKDAFYSIKRFSCLSRFIHARHIRIYASVFMKWKVSSRQWAQERTERTSAAITIQSFARSLLPRRLLTDALSRSNVIRVKFAHFLLQRNSLLQKLALKEWQKYVKRKKEVFRMCQNAFARTKIIFFMRWKDYIHFVRDRQHRFSVRIQSAFRGNYSRRIMQHRLQMHQNAIKIQCALRSILALKKMHRLRQIYLHDLSKVQRILRLRNTHTMKLVIKTFRRNAYVNKIVRCAILKQNGMLLRSTFAEWRLFSLRHARLIHEKATTIQRSYILHVQRKNDEKMRQRNRNATKLQAYCRGVLGRMHVRDVYWQNKSAQKIQLAWRRHASRRTLYKLRCHFMFTHIEEKYYDFIENVLLKCASVRNFAGDTVLHIACSKGSKRLTKLCLRYGIDINTRNGAGETPLHALVSASFPGQATLGEYLLCKGAHVDAKDNAGITPIMLASKLGHINCLQFLLPLASLGETDVHGCCALHLAFRSFQRLSIETLMKAGAELAECIDIQGQTPIHDMAYSGNTELLLFILERCVDIASISIQDEKGFTPLHSGVAGNQANTVQLLLQWGANASAVDGNGLTPLFHAVKKGYLDIVDILSRCDSGTNITSKDVGDTALHVAVRTRNFPLTEILLKNCARTDIRNSQGNQLAHDCAASGDIRIMELLINYDVDMNSRNYMGLTPLGVARVCDKKNMVDLINSMYVECEGYTKYSLDSKRKAETIQAFIGRQIDASKNEAMPEEITHAQFDAQSSNILAKDLEPVFSEVEYDEMIARSVAVYELGVLLGKPSVWLLFRTRCTIQNEDRDISVWHNKRTGRCQLRPPKLIKSLPCTVAHWTQRTDNLGNGYFYNVRNGERVYKDLPPVGKGGKILRKRLNCRNRFLSDKNEVSMSDYETYWNNEMGQIRKAVLETRAAIRIQREYRRHAASIFAWRQKKMFSAAVLIQSCWRRKYFCTICTRLRKENTAATCIQSIYRGVKRRLKFSALKIELERRRDVLSATRLVQRVWRGYLGRRRSRNHFSRTIHPSPKRHEDWESMMPASRLLRTWGVWQEYEYKWPDVFFYRNRVTKRSRWEKPIAMDNYDKRKFLNLWDTIKRGFTLEQRQSAQKIQNAYRMKQAKRVKVTILTGKNIMLSSETKYLETPYNASKTVSPISVVRLCNYMLYLHTILRDYEKARPLYAKAMQYMVQRGPDNAFVLLSYAIFLAGTCEEDFSTILDFVTRARTADPTLKSFAYAEAGYFRQATIDEPRSSRALCNYAICLQFYGTITNLSVPVVPDLDLAEVYYIKALQHDPYDENIIRNFNFMLLHLKHSDIDAYERFRLFQAKQAEIYLLNWRKDEKKVCN